MWPRIAKLAIFFGTNAVVANAEDAVAAKPLEERLQIVGTIAQKEQSGSTQGVVIFKLDGERTVFGTLGKSFEIDQRWYYVVRIDGRHATIANINRSADEREYEILYINPPSNNALIYEAQPDSLRAEEPNNSDGDSSDERSEDSERPNQSEVSAIEAPAGDTTRSNQQPVAVSGAIEPDTMDDQSQPVLVDESEPVEIIEADAEEYETQEQNSEEFSQ